MWLVALGMGCVVGSATNCDCGCDWWLVGVHRCGGVPLEALGLYQPPRDGQGSPVDWGAPLRSAWNMSEAGGLKLLQVGAGAGVMHEEDQEGDCMWSDDL